MPEVIEAKEKKSGNSEISQNSRTMAALAWLLAPLSSLAFVLMDTYKQDKYVQFHAWQSLIAGVILYISWTVLIGTCLIPLAASVFSIIGLIKAFQGEMWKAPLIGDWAEQQAEKAVKGGDTK